jgi:aspartate aminotransferase-like enzyme
MVLQALSGVELTLRDQGVNFTVGSGVAAAIEHFHRTQPAHLAKAA